MDPKLFEQLLSTVAEWRRPTVEQEIEITVENDDPDDPDSQKTIKFVEKRELASAPPEIVKVRHCAETCGDCGKICYEGRRIDIKQHVTHGQRHWRRLCQSCHLGWNPMTEQWDIPSGQMGLFFAGYLRERKAAYATKYSPRKKSED